MKKQMMIGLTLVGLVSCPIRVLGVDALAPLSYDPATVADFTFTKAFFSQFSSLLNYNIKLEYSIGLSDAEKTLFRNNAVQYLTTTTSEFLTDWDNLQPTFAETTLDATWKGYVNEVLFGRNFNETTNKALSLPAIRLFKPGLFGAFDTDISFSIVSSVRYRISPAQVLLAWSFTNGVLPADDVLSYSFDFLANNVLLNTIDFPQQTGTIALDTYKAILPSVITNVDTIRFRFSIIDPTANGNPHMRLVEFNLFATTEQAIPDDPDSENIFGLEYYQVEFFDVLGHINNILWWVVNESFIAPLFILINDFIVQPIIFIFELIGSLLGL